MRRRQVVTHDPWDSGLPYEPFMGRWSRAVAPLFLDWLNQPAGLRWLDVGCGTGALCGLIAQRNAPRAVLGVDPSPAFVTYAARAARAWPDLGFAVATADGIPAPAHRFDVVVSALALNFFPSVLAGLREMRRVAWPGREVAVYVWDYAQGMQMLRVFWDTVVILDPAARPLDEGVRFPICRPEALRTAFAEAGLAVRAISALEAPAVFADFADYWQPFLGGVGPAPGYVASLAPAHRARLAASLRAALPVANDGSITLTVRAWAVRAQA